MKCKTSSCLHATEIIVNLHNFYADSYFRVFTGSAASSGVENVSRSGRVRKKNSFLAAYESLDEIDKPKKKGERVKKDILSTPKVIVLIVG